MKYTNDQGLEVDDVSNSMTIAQIEAEFGGTGWAQVPAPPALTAAQLFDVDIFCQALFPAFAADSNLFPYYAVLKDLATYRNFAGMNSIVNQLVAAGILTAAEQTTLNGILAQQNIVLSTFAS